MKVELKDLMRKTKAPELKNQFSLLSLESVNMDEEAVTENTEAKVVSKVTPKYENGVDNKDPYCPSAGGSARPRGGSTKPSPSAPADKTKDKGKTVKDMRMTDADEMFGLFEADAELNGMDGEQVWHHLQTVMDSGAAESVAPASMLPWVEVEESEGSRRGQTYMSASGDRLPNLGEKQFEFVTDAGRAATATYQIADVTRALCSVSRVCDKGNTVTFTSKGGLIESPGGVRTQFRRENNVYLLDTWAQGPSGFRGQ